MAECDICGEQESMPYHCRHCDGTFCSDHRLPENHDCPGLNQWENQGAVFDSGFDDQVIDDNSKDEGLAAKLGLDTGPGGISGYFRGNVTYLVLLLMAVTFVFQYIVAVLTEPQAAAENLPLFLGEPVGPMWDMIFVFSPEEPLLVWTWVISIFAHGSFLHIVFNGIVIYSFGRLVEQFIGSKQFALLFIASGILAGATQVSYQILFGSGPGVLGASGAALALLGVMTVIKPDLKVYLLFVIPMPISVLTGGIVVGSSLLILVGQADLWGVAHVAHLAGAIIGLAYGRRIKDRVQLPSQVRIGGGGPGGGRPPGPGGPGRRP